MHSFNHHQSVNNNILFIILIGIVIILLLPSWAVNASFVNEPKAIIRRTGKNIDHHYLPWAKANNKNHIIVHYNSFILVTIHAQQQQQQNPKDLQDDFYDEENIKNKNENEQDISPNKSIIISNTIIESSSINKKNNSRNNARRRNNQLNTRMGGPKNRGKKKSPESKSKKDKDHSNFPSLFNNFPVYLIPLLFVVWLFFAPLLFGNDDDSNFVYYQSSVYESTVIAPDGEIQRSRKESFRSNMPDLIKQKQEERSNNNNNDDGSNSFFLDSIDDDDYERQLDSIIRQQSKFLLLDDFPF